MFCSGLGFWACSASGGLSTAFFLGVFRPLLLLTFPFPRCMCFGAFRGKNFAVDEIVLGFPIFAEIVWVIFPENPHLKHGIHCFPELSVRGCRTPLAMLWVVSLENCLPPTYIAPSFAVSGSPFECLLVAPPFQWPLLLGLLRPPVPG